jgi:hypothetical protein
MSLGLALLVLVRGQTLELRVLELRELLAQA